MTDHQASSASAQAEAALYKKRDKIYPREVNGVFAKLRNLTIVVLLGLYYLLPGCRWTGVRPCFSTCRPQVLPVRADALAADLIYLSALLIIAALSLFSSRLSRGACGVAMPAADGVDRGVHHHGALGRGQPPTADQLDREPMSFRKLRVRATKQLLWIAFAL